MAFVTLRGILILSVRSFQQGTSAEYIYDTLGDWDPLSR